MKMNKILLVGVLLLALISIGTVSAADIGIGDNNTLSIEEDTSHQITVDDAVTEDEKLDLDINADSKVLEGKTSQIRIVNFENETDSYSLKSDDFNFTIDGRNHNFDYDNGKINFFPGSLDIGKHDFELKFIGNDKYNPFTFNDSFTVCDAIVSIPDKITYGGQMSNILVELSRYSIGATVTLEINGKTYSQKNMPYEGMDDDEIMYYESENQDRESYLIAFNLWGYNVPCGNHSVIVKVDDKLVGKGNVCIDYVLERSTQTNIHYGFDKSFQIYPQSDMNLSKIVVKIDGIERAFKIMQQASYCKVDCTGVTPGIHNVSITYNGDKKYNKKTFEYTKEVRSTIRAVYNSESEPGFYLYMPDDAQGRLYIYVKRSNETNFSDKPFANVSAAGNVYVPFENLSFGHYGYDYNYTGSDYTVYCNTFKSFIINPEITLPSGKFMLGDSISVSINLPGVSGALSLENLAVDEEYAQVWTKDGNATASLKCTKPGKNTYRVYADIDEYDSNGNSCTNMYWQDFEINVVSPIVSKDATSIYSEKNNYKVQIKDIGGNKVKSGIVTFYILDGSKQISKKTVNIANGAAAFSYKITQDVKKYTIKTVFNKVSVTNKLTVKHAVTLKTVTVKKSAKKLTLQATLSKINGKYIKSKTVTFKFNGKTYKAKTNSKGIAKVTVLKSVLKKLKVGKNINYQATYLKDTVKKTATVKK